MENIDESSSYIYEESISIFRDDSLKNYKIQS